MAYPNYYYPQQYYQPVQQTQNGSPIWVQGEAGAKSYLVAPNSTVTLWDSESQTIYLKSADASGMPTMKVLDYTLREAQKPQNSVSQSRPQYATYEDIKALNGRINDLRDEFFRRSKKEEEEE